MNKSNIYDKKLFKEEFKNFYNDKNYKFDFSTKNNILSNITIKQKNNNTRFFKASTSSVTTDYNKRTLLREFRIISPELVNKKFRYNYLEYVIWDNS